MEQNKIELSYVNEILSQLEARKTELDMLLSSKILTKTKRIELEKSYNQCIRDLHYHYFVKRSLEGNVSVSDFSKVMTIEKCKLLKVTNLKESTWAIDMRYRGNSISLTVVRPHDEGEEAFIRELCKCDNPDDVVNLDNRDFILDTEKEG